MNAMNHKKRSQRGAAAVELAMTLPVLLLFLVVMVDLGLVLRAHQVISNGSREGARFSSLAKNYIGIVNPSASSSEIKQHVVDYCAEEGVTIDASNITLDQETEIALASGTVSGSTVSINVTRPVLFLGGFGGPQTISLRSESTFANMF